MRNLSNLEVQAVGGVGGPKKIPDVCANLRGWRGQVCDMTISIVTSEVFMAGIDAIGAAAMAVAETAANQTPTNPGQRSGRE